MENIVEIPKIHTVQGGQTLRVWALHLSAMCGPDRNCWWLSRSERFYHTDSPVVVHIQPVPFVEYVTPTPVVTCLSTRLRHPPFLAFLQLPEGQCVSSLPNCDSAVHFGDNRGLLLLSIDEVPRHKCRGAEADLPDDSGDDGDSNGYRPSTRWSMSKSCRWHRR